MSKGAFKELIRASFSEYALLVKDIPLSERKIVSESLRERIIALGDF